MTGPISNDAGAQEKVFAFLMDPVAHPDMRRIDTHAASVFLEGARALKIKRAGRNPYLDYSTLSKRKAACDEEMKVNSRFAPQIYRRVVPITQGDDGSLSIDGAGVAVEFAIEMTRFDERQTIDHLAEAGEPDRDLVDAIADVIAASHAVAPPAPAKPWIESIPAFIDDNTRAFRAAAFRASDVDDLEDASQSAFSRIRKLLEQRGKQGYVRRCHGCVGRYCLRSCVPNDGFTSLRPACRRKRPPQQVSEDSILRTSRCPRGVTVVYVAPCGYPRQGAAGPSWPVTERQGRNHASGPGLFQACAAVDPSSGANARGCWRIVWNRKIGSGARACACRHPAAGSGCVAHRCPAKATIWSQGNGSAARDRIPAGGDRENLRHSRATGHADSFTRSFRCRRRGVCT